MEDGKNRKVQKFAELFFCTVLTVKILIIQEKVSYKASVGDISIFLQWQPGLPVMPLGFIFTVTRSQPPGSIRIDSGLILLL